MSDERATSDEDPILAMHGKLDALALAMFEASRSLPATPRDPSSPDPTVAGLAADVVKRFRDVDDGADALATARPGDRDATPAD